MRHIKVKTFKKDEYELSFFNLLSSLTSFVLITSPSGLATGVVLDGPVVVPLVVVAVAVVVGVGPADSLTTVSITLVGELTRSLPLLSSFSSFILSNIALERPLM